MTIHDQFLTALKSASRETFLLAMGHRLGVSARDVFAEDGPGGPGGPDALPCARACNEMMIAIWSQLWATKDPGVQGYPDGEFLSILMGKADMGGARPQLRSAIESSLFLMRESGHPAG
ncbi:hypothetical protein [Streptomyces sp. NPDC018036]|uniref:hypothetical protein n=1 Tax=Streptomyces sp. NPDC018036 TaxID=3365035 RepID=UPI00379E8AC4